MVIKLDSSNDAYQMGELSVFPAAIDSYTDLYQAENNCISELSSSISVSAQLIKLKDGSKFPPKGILKIGSPVITENINQSFPYNGSYNVPYSTFYNDEFVYYDQKIDVNTFGALIRGFLGSRVGTWVIGTPVTSGVMSQHYMACRDAIYNIENYVGAKLNTLNASLYGRLVELENKYLNPRPNFKAYPTQGPPNTFVQFQNYTPYNNDRIFWDFGDGSTSVERNPLHQYKRSGNFSVQLSVITSGGGQGIVTKDSYIQISQTLQTPFFYSTPLTGVSIETATKMGINPTIFQLIDQTNGNIQKRFWNFGDNTNKTELNPNVHYISHVYDKPGKYYPSLFDTFDDATTTRIFLSNATSDTDSNITVI